ncbi:aminopeptidase N [Sphingosinicella soli]|uniref:Aminopeptidase N n=1 Tax=Sphingosinicella soli TaxID=333708 RepID=A0A7W7B4J9_9SPHN|nr:aminopeptidase N [Sphingosinicella soli]MBB4633820.1 aminopeptidase N [Sphingosinicella soli]
MEARSETPTITRREDYAPPAWRVPDISLAFALDEARTRVSAVLRVERAGSGPLVLDGDDLDLKSVSVDGRVLGEGDYTLANGNLTIPLTGDTATVETVVEIAPAANSKLMGLYASGGNLCTQCEAEGFRRVTFFPDRPDVLSRYSVELNADKARYPVLLSNGNPVAAGDLPDGRHFARWDDPFPKPCYLFAVVAGDLRALEDSFETMSGRHVKLAIWVRAADVEKCRHAMQALKDSMRWDEVHYGREYDLDVFNIVAVDDFNFGAMENKGLNIFNSKYILADAETATDADFDAVAAVVAHEYFHNWTGNRITCRDWFQLSLKEGLTVYRDQCFSADMGSPAVKRIEDVRALRAAQFQEDAGPLAHPVRPESYIEISNFYTATVYNKGAEVIRMAATLLGPENYRKGTDLYFERHDGEAATVEDWVKALEDGGGADFGQFRLWYSQAGTPTVTADLAYDPAAKSATLTLAQAVPDTPGQSQKAPMHIPLKIALFGRESGSLLGPEQLFQLRGASATMTFENVGEPPVLSINRSFSAPVNVETKRSAADFAFLSAHDDDPFARYEAMQQLMMDRLVDAVRSGGTDAAPLVEAVGRTLRNQALDHAFIGESILLPTETMIAERLVANVDPDAVHTAREGVRRALLEGVGRDTWSALYTSLSDGAYDLSPGGKGGRRLKNVALGYLFSRPDEAAVAAAEAQYTAATNMTDRIAALGLLVDTDTAARERVLQDFYDRFKGDALVLDKWFTAQALGTSEGTFEHVVALAGHRDFTIRNPNRFRSLVGALAMNQFVFHRKDGAGYRFVADSLLEVDAINPQTAARFIAPFGRWRRMEDARAGMMRAELERIVGTPGVSRDTFEMASKSLV